MSTEKPLRRLAFRIARECVCGRLRLINRVINSIYNEALRPLGLRESQLGVLTGIACLEPVKPAKLSQVLWMDKSTVSRDVEVMRRNGWLEVQADTNGRGNEVRVSPKGAALLEKVIPVWQEAQERTLALLGEAGVNALHQAAEALGMKTG